MEILDQRKESIVNTSYLKEIYASYDGEVKATVNDCLDIITLGEYENKEKATEVVNQIFSSMRNYLRVFEMPKKGE